ncbi:cytochrome c biogenesis protein ResB [Plantibacter sp. Mn2098]|uniref:cytochrome c biogenesis protein ResB n=1 Tax=Plantibacter sp. Mn2098 TaxID=3395266 RepID=UPI003BC60562
MSRPSDHIDSPAPDTINQPKLGFVGWLRFIWRQITSMRTALFLLLLLAIAAIPGSLVPQRSSDPNGVTQYFADNPDLAPILDKVQLFDVYSSAWFSAIYILLFVSLIGCVVPRTKHHFQALRSRPPRTPARLERLAAFESRTVAADATPTELIDSATKQLRRQGYRVERFEAKGTESVSAERGFMRETGNLVFHSALVGILITVGFGGGFGFAGQRVLVEGQTFVNSLIDFDSFNPGRFFDPSSLEPYKLTLDKFGVTYETKNLNAYGQAIDYRAEVTATDPHGESRQATIKVNDPLRFAGTDVYLLGNGYAPTITVKNPKGEVVFSDSIPFLPQDAQLTSLGVVKVPDGLAKQIGMIGFFYPTQAASKAPFFSSYPDLAYPLLTLNVYEGDLGINAGVPKSVYALNVDKMKQITGGSTGVDSIELAPGQSSELPNGLGSVTFENVAKHPSTENYAGSVKRFASFDVHHDPTQVWVLVFALLALGGLITSLLVARRRVWVKAIPGEDGTVTLQYAGLARGEDPGLERAVAALAEAHAPAVEEPETPDQAPTTGGSVKP